MGVDHMDNRLLLRPAEVAQTLGVGRSTVYEMIAAGTLPTVRIGTCLRVPVEALRSWVVAQTQNADEKALL